MADLARFDLAGALSAADELDIRERLINGALLIYPTDTLYAIGCRALDGNAIARLRAAKSREASKALPVIAADLAQARSLASRWPKTADLLAEAFWPGPLTMIVPASPGLPAELLGGATGIAVRVPGLAEARRLASLAGPLVSTSANLAGEPPCLTAESAFGAFPAATLIFDMGPLVGAPSTIVDVTDHGHVFHVLREGRISRSEITLVLEGLVSSRLE